MHTVNISKQNCSRMVRGCPVASQCNAVAGSPFKSSCIICEEASLLKRRKACDGCTVSTQSKSRANETEGSTELGSVGVSAGWCAQPMTVITISWCDAWKTRAENFVARLSSVMRPTVFTTLSIVCMSRCARATLLHKIYVWELSWWLLAVLVMSEHN